jgi:hypothetical protein
MDNPEKLAIQHWVHKAQDEDKDKTKTQHRKLKRLATRTSPKTGVNLFVPCCFFFWALPVR